MRRWVSAGSIVLCAFTFSPRAAAATNGEPIVVSFTIVADNIIVDVRIDGVRTGAILDTGGRNVMTPSLARRLGLMSAPKTKVHGMGAGQVGISQTRVREVDVGGVTMRDQPFYVVPLPYELTNGGPMPVEVDLGYELLKKYVTTIDFVKSEITFTPDGAYAPVASVPYVALSFSDTTPAISATLDRLNGRFLVDAGSSFAIALTSPFVTSHHLTSRYRVTGAGATGQGLGGETYGQLARAKVLEIGNSAIERPVLQLSTDTAGTLASKAYAGVIGLDVLRSFATVTFDYERRTMALQSSGGNAAAAEAYDRTGMSADKNDPLAFTVSGILPGGPAAIAGLRDGDRITAIDGRPAVAVDTQRWWVLAHAPAGTLLQLAITRAHAHLVRTLRLHDVV